MEEERQQRSNRRQSNRRKKKKNKFKILKVLFLAILIIGITGTITVGAIVHNIIKDTEPIDPNEIYELLNENSFIVDKDGNLIEKVQREGLRTNVKFQDIPVDLLDAFIAIEDKTFWDHKGFNIVRIFGAIWDGVSSGDNIKGTSTITQQLARNLYLADTKSERSMERKIKEAYYAVLLEKHLTKEQIIETYLNTIYLGFSANGVQAASQAYFSKDIQDLNIAECSVIAGITKNPSRYAPIKRIKNEDTDMADPNIISVGETYTLLYDERYKDRQMLVLRFMKEYGFITEEEYDEAVNTDMRAQVNPSFVTNTEISSYFTDKVKSDVLDALMENFDISEKEALNRMYNGGLKIYATIDMDMQKIVEKEFKDESNFPSLNIRNKDSYGNIRDSKNRIILYKYSNLVNDDNQYILTSNDYKKDGSGNLVLFKNRKLIFDAIYGEEKEELKDITISIKNIYKQDDIFSIIRGGRILIPNTYKSLDEDGNVVIDKSFLNDNPDFFVSSGDALLIHEKNYNLNAEVIQPQSAMVIMEPTSGEIKALVGGRNVSGSRMFSRATSPAQPGSSIKPLAVYTPALDNGFTAGYVIDDAPMFNDKNEVWPKNWYSGFKGLVTLRYAMQQSVNVAAVKICDAVGIETSKAYLKKFGVTSILETGPINDNNTAALALGGMSHGISPLEMTAAYGTLANKGIYNEPISFTKVEDKSGKVIIDNKPERHTVVEEDVAFIMTDILESSVTSGTGWRAKLYDRNDTIPVAGKTGTTTNNYDAWFMGYTPYYASGLWIGNDLDIKLSQGSTVSAQLWGKIMKQVHEGLSAKSFEKPNNIISVTIDNKSGKLPSQISYMDPRKNNIITELFISGTQPTEYDDIHVLVDIDIFTNRLATPMCPPQFVEQRVFTRRPYELVQDEALFPEDYIHEAPRYYCPIHNPSHELYPTDIIYEQPPEMEYPEGYEDETDTDIDEEDDESVRDIIRERIENNNIINEFFND